MPEQGPKQGRIAQARAAIGERMRSLQYGNSEHRKMLSPENLLKAGIVLGAAYVGVKATGRVVDQATKDFMADYILRNPEVAGESKQGVLAHMAEHPGSILHSALRVSEEPIRRAHAVLLERTDPQRLRRTAPIHEPSPASEQQLVQSQ